MKKKIGFFGGSFDPIHFGHLNLAIQLLEKGGLDEILFCPALYSPTKASSKPSVSAEHRFAMVRLVMTPFFRVTSIEIERKGPSYTIDTLRALDQKNCTYRLILSEESANHLLNWREAEEIIKLAPPLVGSRTRGLKTPFETIETPLYDISSTEVRNRLQTKKYVKHLVPSIVLDYIEEFELYSSP